MTGLGRDGERLNSTKHPLEIGGHELKVTLVIMMGCSPPAMFRCTGKRGKRAISKEKRRIGVEVLCKYVIIMADCGL